ncbi:MAG: DUF5671 domain-containing protein [Candidatus Paceibacterota bacterium]|jgi:hypothetical protein
MQPKTTAKDFFMYLGTIISLYVSVVSFLMLVFAIINKALPLAGEYAAGPDQTIRSTIAAIIVFFPTFIYLLKLLSKDLQAHPEKREYWMRKWMIFLTLFSTGLAMAVDLVTLVYRFLGAEDLTLRFFLKVFFVFAVAVTVFRTSLADLRRTDFSYGRKERTGTIIVSLVMLAAIVYGVIMIGSPATQRARMMDETRVSDLNSIQSQIVYSQWENKGVVPETLDALREPISNYIVPTDPETKESYEYKKISKNSFELCATFKTEVGTTTINSITGKHISSPYPYELTNENWQHGIGRTCFTRTIDEKLYPINKTAK